MEDLHIILNEQNEVMKMYTIISFLIKISKHRLRLK